MPRMMRLASRLALAACGAGALSLAVAPGAGAATFSNTTPLSIPASGNASSYPSGIAVSGIPGPVTDIDVSLNGVSHTSPVDIGVVLVAPSGTALALFDCVGSGIDAAGLTFTIDDSAATQLPPTGALTGGSFRPTGHCNPARSFDAPGPLTSYAYPGPARGTSATLASTFNGLGANGTWNLFVRDFLPGDSGQFAGGWSLTVKPDPTPIGPIETPKPKTKCKKKKKKKGKGATAAAKKSCKKKKKKK
jgi:subtilisin-like proprotein convertase family protein